MIRGRLGLATALALLPGLASAQGLAPTKTVNTVQTPARQTVSQPPALQLYGPAGSQSDLCIGELSGAYGNPMLAVTVDLTHLDQTCARLRQSWFLCAHGYCPAGVQLQCLSSEVRLAMKRAGTPCEDQKAAAR